METLRRSKARATHTSKYQDFSFSGIAALASHVVDIGCGARQGLDTFHAFCKSRSLCKRVWIVSGRSVL
jgi:hypothetical protein